MANSIHPPKGFGLVWLGFVTLFMYVFVHLFGCYTKSSNLDFPYVRQMLYVDFLLQLLFGVAVLFLLRVCIFVCMHD